MKAIPTNPRTWLAALASLTLLTLAPAQSGLEQRLVHEAAKERKAAVEAVARLGKRAQALLPGLLDRTADPDPGVALAVVDACEKLGIVAAAALVARAESSKDSALLVSAAAMGRMDLALPASRRSEVAVLASAAMAEKDARLRQLGVAAACALEHPGVDVAKALLRVVQDQDADTASRARAAVRSRCDRLLDALRAAVSSDASLASTQLIDSVPARNDAQTAFIAQLSQSGQPAVCVHALARLQRLGERAHAHRETVAKKLDAGAGQVRRAATAAFCAIAFDEDRIAEVLAAKLRDIDRAVVREAAGQLVGQRIRLTSSIERLLALLERLDCQSSVVSVLGSTPQLRRAHMQPLLASSDPLTIIAAAGVLYLRGQHTAEDLAPLPDWLASRDEAVRHAALGFVRRLRGRQPELLPTIVKMARGKDRWPAIRTIASFGQAGRPARSKLVSALKDKDLRVRLAAAEALGAIEAPNAEVVKALIRGIKDAETGWACANELGSMGEDARRAVKDIIKLLGQRKSKHRVNLVWSLGRIGHIDERVVKLLTAIAAGEHEDTVAVRQRAIRALRYLTYYDTDVVIGDALARRWQEVANAIVEIARSDAGALCSTACEALGAFSADSAVWSFLIERLHDESSAGAVAGVLLGIGRKADELTEKDVRRVARLLGAGSMTVRREAAVVLAKQPRGRELMSSLISAEDFSTRRAVLLALSSLPAEVDWREELVQALSIADRPVRKAVARHFVRHEDAKPIATGLIAAWERAAGNATMRRTLAEILGGIAGKSEHADKIRLLLAADTDPIVQNIAAR